MQLKAIKRVIKDIKDHYYYYEIRDKVINQWQDDTYTTLYQVHSLHNKHFGNKEVEGYIDDDGTIIIGTLDDILAEVLECHLTDELVDILKKYEITLNFKA